MRWKTSYDTAVTINYVRICFIWRDSPQWARTSSFTKFLDHTKWRTTIGRTPLDEWLARRRTFFFCSHKLLRQTHTHKSRANTLYGIIRRCYPTTKTTIYTEGTIHIRRHKQTGTVKIRSAGTTSTGLTGKENGNSLAAYNTPQFVTIYIYIQSAAEIVN